MARLSRAKIDSGLEKLAQRRRERRMAEVFLKRAGADPASVYDGLLPWSLAFIAPRRDRDRRRVNLIVPELAAKNIFAGIRTAVEVGALVAELVDADLRFILLHGPFADADRRNLDRILREEWGRPRRAEVIRIEDVGEATFSAEDVWVCTHWKTAHPLAVAARAGVVDPSRVLYLIQDYEPGFHGWSAESALSRATYSAEFIPIVNSAPLAQYLRQHEELSFGDEQIFAPALDLGRLERVHAERKTTSTQQRTVFFYARPGRPRNLFPIGRSALGVAASVLADRRGPQTTFVSAGAEHGAIVLPGGTMVASHGKLEWDAYYRLMARVDVALSLQMSPHPSHPPLEFVVSGGRAVTNELDGTRSRLHERLRAVEPDPAPLGEALASAVLAAETTPVPDFDPSLLGKLGGTMENAVEAAVARLRR